MAEETAVTLADYGMESLAREINVAGARLARAVADAFEAGAPERPRYVAGVLGPTNRTASISPDVNNPGLRGVTFDELVASYTDATEGLLEGGADLLLIETIFDTLNAKAAIFAVEGVFERLGYRVTDTGDIPVPIPESADPGDPKAHYLPQIAEVVGGLADRVTEAMRDGAIPLVLGGDHSISIGGKARKKGPGKSPLLIPDCSIASLPASRASFSDNSEDTMPSS